MLEQNNQIIYRWIDYANDSTFTNIQNLGRSYDSLTSLRSYISNSSQIKYTRKFSAPFLFGLTYKNNLFRAQLQWDKILQQAKRKANKLEEDLYFNDPYDNGVIKNELPITKSGWSGSNKIIQALGIKLKELQDDNYLLSEEENSDFELNNNEDLNSENQTIKKLIKKGRIESTVFITQIKVDGLQIRITLTCSLCSSETEYCNEREGDNFSRSIAGAGLIGGVNREELRSILAFLGVTRQNKSAENLLILACEQLQNNKQDILEVLFDCAWSHIREALQASREFIYNRELEEYLTKNGKTITIQKGNYNSSSHQMEHAILITIVEKITPILEKYNIKLNVGVDGDLLTNKTLTSLNLVNQIFMDLKHKAKTIWSKIESDRNWKMFEQPIMGFYMKCIYAASSRADNPEVSTPTDEELAWIYTEGLICHLRGNHNKCWPEVCWIVENPDLILSSPNLIGADENQYKRLLEFLKKITKLKENQSLITTIHTSYNEAFNHLKLNYAEKKTDYPKSFRAQHALSIIHNNEGSVKLQHKVRIAGNLISFTNQDKKNLLSIWKYKN
ncbi:39847_t:CDS:2 [Gigaspora margarita]|uniref:39847_t:CDS:1 n=1 Tax=Gigaspora margarita TaxID=4874 RepID=A0ABN7UAY5_GIGMA|nr:39847_t:CDS:2 [Gigaspora margarita]